MENPNNFFSSAFKAKPLAGSGSTEPISMDKYAGKVVLVVNTASACGFTPQFQGLEALHKKYAEQGLVVLGFPCNQFGGQDPKPEDEIATFCQRNYGVSFQMMEKIDVNGDSAHPIFEWLKSQKSFMGFSRIKWNFEKFLIDRKGHVYDRYTSVTTPQGLESAIEKLLSQTA